MSILHRIRNKWAPVLKSAPTRIKPTEESSTLAEKYAAKLEWMREKGITGSVFEAKRKEPLRVNDSNVVEIRNDDRSRETG
jgi:hypothetical protein